MNDKCMPKELPTEIKHRKNTWFFWYNFNYSIHYIVGVLGVASSSIAAAEIDILSINPNHFAAISTVCIAVLGFIKPDKEYRKYVAAWRLLDNAANNYKYLDTDKQQLFKAMNEGEMIIKEHEDKTE